MPAAPNRINPFQALTGLAPGQAGAPQQPPGVAPPVPGQAQATAGGVFGPVSGNADPTKVLQMKAALQSRAVPTVGPDGMKSRGPAVGKPAGMSPGGPGNSLAGRPGGAGAKGSQGGSSMTGAPATPQAAPGGAAAKGARPGGSPMGAAAGGMGMV